ncbi:O-antigen ligase family protein, partial [Enterococcus faecalis]|nr:O-antigen ligase family protein [Enterococcus faecalis]
ALVFGILVVIQAIYFNNSLNDIISDGGSIVKYLLLFLICIIFLEYQVSIKRFLTFILCINFFLIAGLWIPYIFKVGNYTYQNSEAGFKGFYFATNDITYAFTMFSTIILISIVHQYTTNRYYFIKCHWGIFFLNLASLFLISTKFGLAYLLLMIFYIVYNFIFFNERVNARLKFLFVYLVIASIIFIVVVGHSYIFQHLSNLFSRISYFYYYYDGNWIDVLTSSRSIYLKNAIELFKEFPNSHLILWFGFGFSKRVTLFGRAGNIEMDFLDTLFSFGIIGMSLLIVTLMFLFFKIKDKGRYLFILTLVYAASSGHVFYSGMSTMIFGIVLARILKKENNLNEDTYDWPI